MPSKRCCMLYLNTPVSCGGQTFHNCNIMFLVLGFQFCTCLQPFKLYVKYRDGKTGVLTVVNGAQNMWVWIWEIFLFEIFWDSASDYSYSTLILPEIWFTIWAMQRACLTNITSLQNFPHILAVGYDCKCCRLWIVVISDRYTELYV